MVWGECARGVAVEAGLLVSVLVDPFVFLCYDGYFREYRDHTGSPAILVGEFGVM